VKLSDKRKTKNGSESKFRLKIFWLKLQKWSGRLDSNQRPHPPQGCAIPGFATSRPIAETVYKKRSSPENQGYHLRSRSVKKLRSESRKSRSILRSNCRCELRPFFVLPFFVPVSNSNPSGADSAPPGPANGSSRKCRRAPAMVKPSS
jgi:hypothetical protein